jgi:hypothetical protein
MNNLFEESVRQTILSPDRVYRYCLWREWATGEGYCAIVGLNPSKADEVEDDPTITRCIAFAKSWGCNALCMLNLFAYRATKPEEMKKAIDPIGPDNNKHLIELTKEAKILLAAWGTHGNYQNRDRQVLHLLSSQTIPALWKCLGKTQDGFPRHPLFVRADEELIDFYDPMQGIK